MQETKAAFCGSAGAYAHIALQKIFPFAESVPFGSFAEAYRSVEHGLCDTAVLPLENSFAGEISTVTDLIFTGGLYINLTADMPIRHCLLCAQNAGYESITTVFSHPQAVAQCAVFLNEKGLITAASSSTATAAEYVQMQKDDTLAAIASAEAAEIYGLKVLERDINDAPDNTTKFAVFSRTAELSSRLLDCGNERFVLVFTVPDEAGALARALDIIGARGFNLSVLRSRPMKRSRWKYYFYAEADGNVNTENGRSMLNELDGICTYLKLAGTFKSVTLT